MDLELMTRDIYDTYERLQDYLDVYGPWDRSKQMYRLTKWESKKYVLYYYDYEQKVVELYKKV